MGALPPKRLLAGEPNLPAGPSPGRPRSRPHSRVGRGEEIARRAGGRYRQGSVLCRRTCLTVAGGDSGRDSSQPRQMPRTFPLGDPRTIAVWRGRFKTATTIPYYYYLLQYYLSSHTVSLPRSICDLNSSRPISSSCLPAWEFLAAINTRRRLVAVNALTTNTRMSS